MAAKIRVEYVTLATAGGNAAGGAIASLLGAAASYDVGAVSAVTAVAPTFPFSPTQRLYARITGILGASLISPAAVATQVNSLLVPLNQTVTFPVEPGSTLSYIELI